MNNPFELILDRLNSIQDKVGEIDSHLLTGTSAGATKPISRRELCEFLGVTEPTVIRWEKRGKIPVMRIGSAVRYDRSTVIKALEVKKKGGVKP